MNSTELLAKLHLISQTTKKTEKLEIVKTFTSSELDIVVMALDPRVSYYIADFPAAARWGSRDWMQSEIDLLLDLSERRLTGNAALEAVKATMEDLTPSAGELLKRIVLKDLRAGIGASTVNKAFPGAVPEFAYMRCSLPKSSNMHKWDWADGIYSQLKANGMFTRADVNYERTKVLITTRQGNTFPAGVLRKLEEDCLWVFKGGTQTHGELTVWRDGVLLPRAEGNGMLNSVMQGGELEAGCEVYYDVWDQIPLDQATPGGRYQTPYSVRFSSLLQQVREGGPRKIYPIESRLVYSYEEALDHYREVLGRKLEGTVLKHPEAIWFDGDSKDQVKMKLEVDVDLKIIGFNPGKPGTRTEATFGSLQLATSDGLLEASAAGFKRDLEMYLHNNRESVLGKIMTIRANEVSPPCETNPLHSLYHPRAVELRHDKVEADTLHQVLDQFEAAVSPREAV
jgi:DNA ligase-1